MSVRFGLIGYGAWGQRHAAAIEATADAELVAVAAPSDASRARARQEHPAVEAYADYNDLVARADIDIVAIVVPNYLHAPVASAALEAGKHVLLEKPMATTAADCRTLQRLAANKKRMLIVGFELRLSELWGGVKKLIDEGKLGAVRYVLIELWRRPYRRGAEGWRYDINRVGDWVLEEPVHFFDLARWYCSSLGDPAAIYAAANSNRSDHPELQDSFSAILRFADGAQAVVTHTLAAFEHHQTVKVAGTKGAVWASWSGVMDRDEAASWSLRRFDGEQVREVDVGGTTGELVDLSDEIAMAVATVKGERRPAAGAEDGYWSVALCEAAQQSIAQRREIDLTSLLK